MRGEEWGRLIVPAATADHARALMVLERAAAALALNRLIEQAPFHVHISARYRLDQAAEAHRAVEEHHLGKITLKIASNVAD